MIVYHGSYTEVIHPKLTYSRSNLDFGRGFYVTPIYEQAIQWSKRLKVRKGIGIISHYQLDIEECTKDFRILEFNEYSEAWLNFIVKCRQEKDTSTYDIIIGGVANDKVFNTIELYFEGLIEQSEAIKRLKYEKPNYQICLRNQILIDKYLLFIKSEVI